MAGGDELKYPKGRAKLDFKIQRIDPDHPESLRAALSILPRPRSFAMLNF
jgi:hypothetical protein